MMKKLRVTIDDLLEGLRQAGSFSIEEVDFAIMETNGKISVQPKQKYEPVSKGDMKLNVRDKGFSTVVISDGRLCEEVFSEFSKVSEEDVMLRLREKNLTVEDVFLMTVNEAKEFVIIKKEAKR